MQLNLSNLDKVIQQSYDLALANPCETALDHLATLLCWYEQLGGAAHEVDSNFNDLVGLVNAAEATS